MTTKKQGKAAKNRGVPSSESQATSELKEAPLFTPGPWSAHLGDDGKCNCLVIGGRNHPIATIEKGEWGDTYLSIRQVGPSLDQKFEPYIEHIPYGTIPEEESLANARLIAAAPDLFAAARLALAALPQHRKRPNSRSNVAIRSLRDAISLATRPDTSASSGDSIATPPQSGVLT